MRRTALYDRGGGGSGPSPSPSPPLPRDLERPARAGLSAAGSASATTRSNAILAAARSSAAPPHSTSGIGSRAPSSSASSSVGPRAPSSANSEYDLESLLGWDRTRAAERAADDRALRDRILARERDAERERRSLLRGSGSSSRTGPSELADLLAGMMSRNSAIAGAFDDEAGPALDANGQPKKLTLTLHCFSFAVVDKQHLQMGDKLILPPEALYRVQAIRLPFPLLFRIENWSEERAAAASSAAATSALALPVQYAGVLEFSAPEDHIYLPSWMMENLRLTEGGRVRIHSEVAVPQGQWVKLVPHSVEFSKILRELGPKYFLEMALRHYSVLTKGQRILITHAGANYSLNVEDTRPATTISLLGNLDLEVEFGIALDAPKAAREEADGAVTFRSRVSGGHALPSEPDEDEDLRRAMAMSLAESGLPAEHLAEAAPASPPPRLSPTEDEGWAVASSSPSAGVASSLQARFGGNRLAGGASTLPNPAAATESKEDLEAAEDDLDDESEAEEDSAPVDLPPNHSLCPSCNKPISNNSLSLHSLHCARAFFKCLICSKMVKKIEADTHAASHVTVACPGCNIQLQQKKLRRHQKSECTHRPVPCRWCAQPTPLLTLPIHEAACGAVTEDCSICAQPIARSAMASHPNSEGCRIQCGKCDEVIASKDIVSHTATRCSGRLVACPHCKLSFAFRETKKHESYCGSRTEACDTCQRYIKLRDMQEHIDSACTFPPVEPKPAARASPTFDAMPGASARMNLLSSMLESGSSLDPSIMASLLSQQVDFEDPLAAAARRSAAASAQRQAASVRERLSRAKDAAERSSSDESDDFGVGRSSGRSVPKAKPVVRASSIRRSPPPAAAAAPSAARASSVPRSAPAPGSVTCAYCQDRCASLESLQVHILTECHDAHSRMEIADPAAAAKALAGMSREVERDHVSVKIPVAKPVVRAASSSSSASASASPPPSSASSSKPFDPYDLSWKRPHRDANEELMRYTASRKSQQPARDLAESGDSDVEILPSRKPTVAAAVTKPKLITSNAKLRPTASSSVNSSASATASKRLSSRADEDDQPSISSYLSGSSAARPSRTPFTTTPLSLKQQQKEVARSISTRKADDAKPSARALAALIDSDDDVSPVRPRVAAPPKRVTSSTSSSIGGRVSGVSPSYMAGLGADGPSARSASTSASSATRASAPKPSSSGISQDYDAWLKSNFPSTAVRLDQQAVASTTRTSAATSSASSLSYSSTPSYSSGSARGPSSPLSAYLGGSSRSSAAVSNGSSSNPPPSSSSYSSSYSSGGAASPRPYAGASSLDPPLSGSRKPLTTSPHVPLYRPASPPSHQKAPARTSASHSSNLHVAGSNSSSALPSRSFVSSSVAVDSSSRVRGSSLTRAARSSAAAAPSAHAPLFSSSSLSAAPSAARKTTTAPRKPAPY